MKSAISTLALALGANVVLARDMCHFQLTTSGWVSGVVGQLDDGQNRVGGSFPTGSYTIDNGAFTDDQGRGCILTPPTSQFQCDVGAAPTPGFSIDCDGSVSYEGSATFYACPATDTEFNIYTIPDPNQKKCVEITLSASDCYASCPAPPPPPSGCPADLPSNYQFPHLIIPISESHPNTAPGTSYNGLINNDTSSIFNFDIPDSYTGDCTLEFLFPTQDMLETSSYTFSGDGVLAVEFLSGVATQDTTYENAPDVEIDLGYFTVTPGTVTTIATEQCPSGWTVSLKVSAVSGTSLEYFQDYNTCPIGLYVTTE